MYVRCTPRCSDDEFLCDDEADIGGEIEGEDLYDEGSCMGTPGYSRVAMPSQCRDDSKGFLHQCPFIIDITFVKKEVTSFSGWRA